MSSINVDCVVKAHSGLGGPVWQETDATLLYVDIYGPSISRCNCLTKEKESMSTETYVGCVVPRSSGGYVIGEGTPFAAVDWEKRSVTTITHVDTEKSNTRFNDGKVDPASRFSAGTMAVGMCASELERKRGSLYTLQPDHSVVKHLDQVDLSNGLDWSPDHHIFYTDSLKYMVEAFDYDLQTGGISNRRMVYGFEEDEGLPDGMCTNMDSKLWVACYNGGRVIRIDPQTGTRLQTVQLRVAKITTCCFGGKDYSRAFDLYITSATKGMDEEALAKQPEAGSIFKVTGLGVKGIPPYSFDG
ncbi:regucalcin-like [Electrophorus electricus]|uniref:regucalcin-like n=1 Tax=Electrophorus electricus TaxID=8005 RepID=UPI0015CFE7EF|nr:regucalcin-like [Electrophorus electricus]